jgi:phosphoglycolate phosphatase
MRGMRYPLVIFDFDGTLADSFPFFVKAQHALAQRHGFTAIDEERVEDLRRLGTRELLQELKFPTWKVPIVAADFIRMMRGAPPVPLFPGVADVLRQLLDAELMEAIELIDGGAHVLGKHRRIARMLKQAKADASQAIYIGDQVSDGEAARRVGVAFGAVGWGYSHADTLRAMGAEEFFETVPELGRLAL